MPRELIDFDPTRHLTTPEARAAFIADMLTEGTAEEFGQALAIVARAQSGDAPHTNVGGSIGEDPRLSDVSHTLDLLGLRLTVAPKERDHAA